VALAVRACILAFFADVAGAFRVGHFDLSAVFGVGERLASARGHFEARLALTADDVAGVGQGAAARRAVRQRDDAVTCGGGILGGCAGVF